jgi:hypothetical protein
MNRVKRLLLATAFVLAVVVAPPGQSQVKTQKDQNKAAVSPEQDTQKKNMQEYISLLRSDVRQQIDPSSETRIVGCECYGDAMPATSSIPTVF